MPNFPTNCLKNAKSNLENLISENRTKLAALLAIKEKCYMNFVRPYMENNDKISLFFTPISQLQNVNNNAESQEAFTVCLPILAAFNTEQTQNIDAYNAFVEIKRKEYKELNKPAQKLLDDTIFMFELEGVNLPADLKSRIKEINIQLSELADQFSQNVLNATNAYEMIITDESIIKEMPDTDKESAKVDNGWRFTLQMPSYIAFMTYATDRAKREELYKQYCTRAPENGKLIEQILDLRAEKAKILGFNNYAELNLKTMSAPNIDAVLNFLDKLAKAAKSYAKADMQEIFNLAKVDGIDEIKPYDQAYYSEKLKKAKYDFDEESLRPYFEQESVMKGMFEMLNKLFDIKFVETPAELWHPKAKKYQLMKDGKSIATLFTDLEARKEKRGGAWMHNWHTHHRDENNVEHKASAFITCNFPSSDGNTPSLLRHDDVSTLFHEMGHGIHHIMSQIDELGVSGVNGVDWDTVEFPSQFLENFAYNPQLLKMLGKHYKTGEIIPDELIEKITKAKNFQEGFATVRQVEFATFDMLIHMDKYNESDVQRILDNVRKEVSVAIPPEYNKFQNGFSHIFSGGYAAGYYSYKWAEMLSADAFLEFEKNGVFNKNIAKKYADSVLSLGAGYKMNEIYKLFVGRDPNPESILILAGLN